MFSWDHRKAQRNFDKHGVSFEEAGTIFADLAGLHLDDEEHSDEEERFFRIGLSSEERILTVIYTIRRLKNGKETIRIISARRSSQDEREEYWRRGT